MEHSTSIPQKILSLLKKRIQELEKVLSERQINDNYIPDMCDKHRGYSFVERDLLIALHADYQARSSSFILGVVSKLKSEISFYKTIKK